MKLYYFALSGHAHRAHLFLSLIGADHELINLDLANGEHKKPPFLALNPFGQVPVLDDDGVIVSDSVAIMVYAAKKLGKTEWLPEDATNAAHIQRWLSVAAGQIAYGPCAARLVTVFGAKFNPDEVIARAHAILTLLDAELANKDWLVTERATVADIALYSYIVQAPEGNVDISSYHNIDKWLRRIEALPGFVPFTQTPAGLRASA
ncbi:glutathione S-transferase family protein [Thalassospira marina]|uniref:Glutathione S-transferase n=1 Tax=Thalassospira marina TaxID=2048283 RepID=A0A2N3KRC1_9PROT|nr:glutathione S-transferase [Thalassospira marina]AUG53576.1 glutathione S-transferase [Thalassospira marina]PKR53108.1 glutathione S-transferase [Thalassospira marina]